MGRRTVRSGHRRSARWPRTPLATRPQALSNLLQENRRFAPPAELAAAANVTAAAYDEADADRLAFWEKQADRLTWAKRWDTDARLDNPPFAKWFVGGKLNVAYNCVDRHVEAGNGDKVAYHWEGEPGDTRTITYAELKDEVCKAANALLELGVGKGDRVADLHADDPRGRDRDAGLRPASARPTRWSSAGSPPTR